MKRIELTQGFTTVVDDADYEALSAFKWHVLRGRNVNYATRTGGSRMHREIMNPPGGMVVDHINGDGLDNRRSNLRICTRSQNLRGFQTPRDTASGFRGVYWVPHVKKWRVRVDLGLFESVEDAAQAYNNATRHYFGEVSPPAPVDKAAA